VIHYKINSAMAFPQVWRWYDTDVKGSAFGKFDEYFLSNVDQTLVLDFKATPMLFEGKKFVFFLPTLAANDYFFIEYFGWEE